MTCYDLLFLFLFFPFFSLVGHPVMLTRFLFILDDLMA